MKVMILSDVHTEFHMDGGSSFVNSLDPEGIDVLILAGDISVAGRIPGALGLFCKRFECPVLYVLGNHEYYHSTREKVQTYVAQAKRENPNLVWLDTDVCEIQGQRFLGATLWFPEHTGKNHYKLAMNDFAVIKGGFENWVYNENALAVKFIQQETQRGDIVITHHLPSQKSVSPRFAGSALNHYFCCPVDEIIEKTRPALWVHGHTHDSCDYTLGDTRIVCNPFGYVRHEINPEFKDALVIDV